jgi:hypothetical protein
LFGTVRELLGAVGVRIDDEGVGRGSAFVPWSQVSSVERREFGVVRIVGRGRRLDLRTYLFADRERVEAFIEEKAPRS